MKESLSGRCGYCGKSECSNTLVLTSRRGGKEHFKVDSNCTFFVTMKRAPKSFSQRVKCTNHLMKCIHCGAAVWKYNMAEHYGALHENCELTEEVKVSQKEKDFMLKN